MVSRYDLIGEGQKIDRMIHQFALKYHRDNPENISEQCAYGLSYLMIMLQSELHNPMVPQKMSLSQFEKLGKDIPDFNKFIKAKDLRRIYQSISQFSMADYQGFMEKTFVPQEFLQKTVNKMKEVLAKGSKFSVGREIKEEEKLLIIYDLFNNLLSSNLIIAFSVSFEKAQNMKNVKKLI